MYLKGLVVVFLLLLSACGGSFNPGDKVVVVMDAAEVRSGYMIGKFVSSKGDSINVEIRKFKNMNAPDDLVRGDEESYPANQVYSYEDGKAIATARKKFFKEKSRLTRGIMQAAEMSDRTNSILQSMIPGGQNSVKSLVKSFMKEMNKHARKSKMHEDKIDSLQALAEEGKLKEWQKAVPLLQVLLEAQSSEANSLDDIYSEMHASMDKMDEDVGELTDVFKSMSYIDSATGSSSIARFVGAVYGSTYAAYQGKVMSWVQKNKLKNPDAKTMRRFLDLQKENLAIELHAELPVLSLQNIYSDGDFDDQIESIHDKIDALNDDHSIYDMASRSFIKQKLADMKTFKQPQTDTLKQLQGNLSVLGSSEENLEIDLADLLDQAYGAYEIVRALEKDHWQGKWKFKRYHNKNVSLLKVAFVPMVSSDLNKVTFSGDTAFSLSDRGGRNIQKFDAKFKISDDKSFQFHTNIRGASDLKCNFMDNHEVQCTAPRASSSLTLYSKEQRAALKAKLKAEKKAREEAAKGLTDTIHKPAGVSPTVNSNTKPKLMTHAEVPVKKSVSVKSVDAVQVHQQIKAQHQTKSVGQSHTVPARAPSHPRANNRLSHADSRKLDVGIQTLKSLL